MRKWLIGGLLLGMVLIWMGLDRGTRYDYLGPTTKTAKAREQVPEPLRAAESEPGVAVRVEASLNVAGRVVDAQTLAPIEGAGIWSQRAYLLDDQPGEVVYSDEKGAWLLHEEHEVYWSEQAGRWSLLGAGDWVILAEAPGYFRGGALWLPAFEGDQAGPTLALKRQAPLLSGRVVDPAGRPLDGARVWAQARVGHYRSEEVVSLADGSFALGEVPAEYGEQLSLWAVKEHLVGGLWVGQPEPRLTLKPGCRLSGQLLDPLGRGVVNGTFKVNSFPVTTDGAGHFMAVIPKGRADLVAAFPRLGRLRKALNIGDDEAALGVLKLEPARIIEGRLVDLNGLSLAEVTVEVMRRFEGEPTRQTQTNEKGRFHLPWNGGNRVTLKVDHPKFGTGYRRFDLEAGDVTWTLREAGTLAGKVEDGMGRAMAGVPVDLFAYQGRRVFTDTEGRFRFERVAMEKQQLRVRADGYQDVLQVLIPGEDGNWAELAVVMNEGAILMGEARLANGDPAIHASVTLTGETSYFGVSDGAGHFRFTGLKPDLYTMEVGIYPRARDVIADVEREVTLPLRAGVTQWRGELVSPHSVRAFINELLGGFLEPQAR